MEENASSFNVKYHEIHYIISTEATSGTRANQISSKTRLARHGCQNVTSMSLRITGNNTALNAALVDATEDSEGALLTPRVVPGVDASPVRGTVVDAPADHLDGVAAEGLAGNVLVDTWVVERENERNRERDREDKFIKSHIKYELRGKKTLVSTKNDTY